MKRAVIGVTVAASLLLLAAALYRSGLVQVNRPDTTAFSVRGIDVSNHQGDIDWSLVAGPGTRFPLHQGDGGERLSRAFEPTGTRPTPPASPGVRITSSPSAAPGASKPSTSCAPRRRRQVRLLRSRPSGSSATASPGATSVQSGASFGRSFSASYVTRDSFERVVAGEF